MLAKPGMGWQTFHTFADAIALCKACPAAAPTFGSFGARSNLVTRCDRLARFDELLAHARRASQKLCFRELGRRYANHPDLRLADIGSVGLWAEWHMSGTKLLGSDQPVPLPSPATRLAFTDAWCQVFPDKPKVMLIGDLEGMKHALR